MKYLPFALLGACSMFTSAPAANETQPPKECVGPPGEFQGVKLAICQSSTDYLACAYVFLTQDAKVCWAVLAQPKADCHAPFSYVSTQCAPQEESAPLETKKSNWYDDAHDEEGWDAQEA